MDEDQTIRITLRIPSGLHTKVSEEADKSSRSLNGEILARLTSSFEGAAPHLPADLRDAIASRATVASRSFDAELVRVVIAGLDRKAPAVLVVEVSNAIPLSKIAALIKAAQEQLPPDTAIRFRNL